MHNFTILQLLGDGIDAFCKHKLIDQKNDAIYGCYNTAHTDYIGLDKKPGSYERIPSLILIKTIPNVLPVSTLAKDRQNYIAHPPTGEKLTSRSIEALKKLRDSWGANLPKGQIVISDGLNAKAIMDEDHLAPYLDEVRRLLAEGEVPMSEKNIVVTGGRIRVGYQIGELLFENADPDTFHGILHIIGERPGTMHHSYSVYITVLKGKSWQAKRIDHVVTKLVCNIAKHGLRSLGGCRGNHYHYKRNGWQGNGWKPPPQKSIKFYLQGICTEDGNPLIFILYAVETCEKEILSSLTIAYER